ncbi:hypothetical protein BDR05DRAFT_953712 [Suillus weaverae]|nr:hypothetical protein BDR05DRAFT_953712 [Suillus weaverae]
MASGSCQKCLQDCITFNPSVEGDELILPTRVGVSVHFNLLMVLYHATPSSTLDNNLPLPSIVLLLVTVHSQAPGPPPNINQNLPVSIHAATISSAYTHHRAPAITGSTNPDSSMYPPLPPMPTYQPSSHIMPYTWSTFNAPSSGVPLPGPCLHTLNGSSQQQN